MLKATINFRKMMDIMRKCVVNENKFAYNIRATFDTKDGGWVVTPGNSKEHIVIPQEVAELYLPKILSDLAVGDIIDQCLSSSTLNGIEQMWGPRCNADGTLDIEFGLVDEAMYKVGLVDYPEFALSFVVDHRIRK